MTKQHDMWYIIGERVIGSLVDCYTFGDKADEIREEMLTALDWLDLIEVL